jgi:hypothetical protein
MIAPIREKHLITKFKITLPFPMTRAKNPPTIPALPAPTGQPGWPQKGHTDELAYIPAKISHQVRNLNKPPIKGYW